tara:strand:+ start:27 stop:206 length:180 start_codon:yes stop_codon:yes gene_type:complete
LPSLVGIKYRRAEQKESKKCEKAGRSGYYAITLKVITTLHIIGLGNKLKKKLNIYSKIA